MKNFKRILALVIAIVMVVGTFASLSAAGSKWYSEAVTFIEENGIAVIGANADKKITRNEFVLWVAKIESHQQRHKIRKINSYHVIDDQIYRNYFPMF